MGGESGLWPTARRAVRGQAHRAPALYNLRNQLLALPQLARRRVHDPDLLALGVLADHPAPLVYDVGANVGQSIVSIKRILPRAEVVAFEPNPGPAAASELVARLHRRVTVRRAACSRAGGGTLTLHVPEARGVVLSQLASVQPPDHAEVLQHLRDAGFGWAEPDDVRFEAVEVPVVALADLGRTPDAVKVDVEGAELEVLAGAGPLLDGPRRPRVLVVERGDQGPVAELLGAHGYALRHSSGINAVYEPDELPAPAPSASST